MNVLYLFGPSMGALGQRDPDTYGSQTLAEIMEEWIDEPESSATRWRGSSPITKAI
jgi:3-dehydroquinate dehydratase